MWCENGLRESARPCCFSAAECLFWASVVCVREDAARLHQNYHGITMLQVVKSAKI